MTKTGWYIFFILVLAAIAGPLGASEVRVDNTGSLSLVLSDESSEINPYMLGNPAGLALLPRVDRLDLGAPFYSTSMANSSHSVGFFGFSPRFIPSFPNLENSATGLISNTIGPAYQGFLGFLTGKWAYQITGGFFNIDDIDAWGPGTHTNNQWFHEVIRTAVDFDALSLGTEIQLLQHVIDQLGNNYSSSTVINFNELAINSNTGFLLNFQLGDKDHPAWLRLGGSALFNIVPLETNISVSPRPGIIPPAQSWTNKDTNYSGAPGLFLDIPSSFEAGIVAIYNYDIMTTNFINAPIYKYDDNNTFNIVGLYKWKVPLAAPGLTFNNGALVSRTYFTQSYYDTTGYVVSTFEDTGFQLQLGAGLEKEKDFALGLQVDGNVVTGNQQFLGTNYQFYNFDLTQVSLGGEKWISPHWALRLGFTYEDASNTGPQMASDSFYIVYPHQEAKGVRVIPGIGYEDPAFHLDGMVWFEQPGSSNPSGTITYTYTVIGLTLNASIRFN